MKFRSLRRAGALLLALALVCSLLTLPVAAAASIGGDFELYVGKTKRLKATGMTEPVYWFSSREDVATVTDGRVKAVAPGTAIIRAMDSEGVDASCTVTVKEVAVPATGVSLNTMFLEREEEDPSVQLIATVTPSNSTDTVSWSSSDPDVVSVDQRGSLTFLKPGSARITAAAGDKNAYCLVNVSAKTLISSVTVTPSSLNLAQGGTATLEAHVEGKADNKSVTWMSSSPSVRVIATGTHTARVTAAGDLGTQATITAISAVDPSKYDICVVSVIEPAAPEVKRVDITSPSTDSYRYVDPGKTITLAAQAEPLDASEADRTIRWESSDDSIATVSSSSAFNGIVRGRSTGAVTITAAAAGDASVNATREIEVSGIKLSYLKSSLSGGQGETVSLTETSTVDIYQDRNIVVSVQPFGFARNNLINWESSDNSVASVVNGRVTGNYPGEATITAAVAGNPYSAKFRVRVSEDMADAVNANMGAKSSYSLSGLLGELNSRSQSKTGAPLDSLYNLKVSTKNGVLYYKYISPSTPGHAVGGAERYYYQAVSAGQMALKDVTFVPLPGFSGTAVVEYSGEATSGATFSGTIRIQATVSGEITYTTAGGRPVSLAADDFSSICMGRSGRALGYVTFSQPSSSQGTLYYNYNPGGLYAPKVESSTRYYASSKPSIHDITFVPASGYKGDVTIPYRCTDSSGATFSGSVIVTVSSASGGGSGATGSRDVEYYTELDHRQDLNGSDFNDACQWATGHGLDRIRFDSLPSSGAGTLYLDYTSSSAAEVSTGRDYYLGSTPRISSISFVPARSYSGTVNIPFTGYDSSGTRFSGTLTIVVGNGSRTISYKTTPNGYVRFNASDFNNACRRDTGDTLDYVRFHRVSTSYGALYYQYNAGSRTGTDVTTGTNYYYSDGTRLLGNVTFAANSSSGATTLDYTGYNVRGESFSGTVEVTVSSGSGGSTSSADIVVYYTGCSAPIRFRASDFQAASQTVLENPLSSIQFSTLPEAGRLYQNYGGSSRTGAAAGIGTRYDLQALDQISYVPQAEYQGTVTFLYTGYDTQGAIHSGTVEIRLSNSYCATPFTDVAYGWDWAKPSIEYLRQSGITSGYRDNTFRPGQSISRGEFTLMICRAFQFSTTGESGFPDVPAGSSYAGAVAAAKELGIVQGDNGLFRPNQPITRQSAMTMICRALNAAGESVPDADITVLFSYGDGTQVSDYARSSVAALIQMGAVRGNSAMLLNPGSPISRAEMAVILHRVLAR